MRNRAFTLPMLTACMMLGATLTCEAQSEAKKSSAGSPFAKQHIAYPVLNAPSDFKEIQNKINSLKFNEAREAIEAKIQQAKKKKESTAALEKLLTKCTDGTNALSGTERVLIVDSVVVDKHSFLKAYCITPDIGTLTMSGNGETVSYTAQLNNMELVPLTRTDAQGRKRMVVARHYQDDDISSAQPLEGLDVDGDMNYPFLLPDGQRFYFAARTAEGHGNYDLYATRYDNDSKRFYRAENMGFPYNSYANDYMLVIDEANGVGWFASDRYQPEGKVCVYTFIPNESRHTFDDGELTEAQLNSAASLHNIKRLQTIYTDKERSAIAAAKITIESLSLNSKQATGNGVEFIINDATTYHSLNEFRSAKARQLYQQWQQNVKNLNTLQSQLDDMRNNPTDNTQKILNCERRMLELQKEATNLAKQIRKEEVDIH